MKYTVVNQNGSKVAATTGDYRMTADEILEACEIPIARTVEDHISMPENGMYDINNLIIEGSLEDGELQQARFIVKDEYIGEFYGWADVDLDEIENGRMDIFSIEDLKELARGWSVNIWDVLNMVEEM